MKTIIALLAVLTTASIARAKIDSDIRVVVSRSEGPEATQLANALRRIGAQGYVDFMKYERLSLVGEVQITNCADCETHRTVQINLRELNKESQEIRELTLDSSTGRHGFMSAENFNALLNRWGGSLVAPSCTADVCWKLIRSIDCTHYIASGRIPAYDSCRVEISTD